jgi:hypothetical protein
MHRSAAVASLALVACLAACGGGAGGEVGAYKACTRAVGTQLKAPATADFSGFSDSVTTVDGDLYSVSGSVDSENSFGAMIRSIWTCQVRDTGDNWDLITIKVA